MNGSGTGEKKAEEKGNDLLNLEDEKSKESANNSNQPPPGQIDNEKKSKVTIQLSAKTHETIKTFVSLGLYDSVDQFINEAVSEKSSEMIEKVRNSLKRKN